MKLIDLFQPILFESIEMVQIRHRYITVVINPNNIQFENMSKNKLRGMLDYKNNLYIWDSHLATHYEMEVELCIRSKEIFKFWHNICTCLGDMDEDEIRSTPSIKNIYGNKNFEIEMMHNNTMIV